MILRFIITLFLTVFILCSKGYTFFVEPVKQNVSSKDTALVDFRDTVEFKKLHIKGSVNLNFKEMWRLFSETPLDFFLSLSALGITPDKKVLVTGCEGDSDELINCLAFAYQLNYGNYEDIRILKGNIKKWQKSGLPLVSFGEEIAPKQWKFKLKENYFYQQSKRGNQKKKKKDLLLTLDDSVKNDKKFARSIYIDFRTLPFTKGDIGEREKWEEYFKRLQLSSENVLIIYPADKKESFALAFLLRFFLGYEKIFILKGVI